MTNHKLMEKSVEAKSSIDNGILNAVFDSIEGKVDIEKFAIKEIYLSHYFNVVKLNSNKIGCCLNYCKLCGCQVYDMLIEMIEKDPLLVDFCRLQGDEFDLLRLNLQCCVVNALSHHLTFENVSFILNDRVFDCESCVIIGFGGYMTKCIRNTNIKYIHVSDFSYRKDDIKTKNIDAVLENFRSQFPHKIITISDGSDNARRIRNSEFVSITASAFCNGTIDDLLENSKSCKVVIVQGQSGFIYPEKLFDNGVHIVSSTVKPDNLLDIAKNNFCEFKRLTEGGMPYIHFLSPKMH